jgi:hypothetical protein
MFLDIIHRPVLIQNTQRFGDRILSPSCCRTYSLGSSGEPVPFSGLSFLRTTWRYNTEDRILHRSADQKEAEEYSPGSYNGQIGQVVQGTVMLHYGHRSVKWETRPR